MTERGFKLIAEILFDVEQLTVQCENERERELVKKLDRAIKNLHSEYDVYYNRRKEKIIEKDGGWVMESDDI